MTVNSAVTVNNAPVRMANGAGIPCTTVTAGVIDLGCAGGAGVVNADTGNFRNQVQTNVVQSPSASDIVVQGPGGQRVRVSDMAMSQQTVLSQGSCFSLRHS